MATREKNVFLITTLIIIMTTRRFCDASLQINPQSTTTENEFEFIEIQQEKMEQLKIPKDQTLIVRLPSNTLLKYNSYKDVSILHFRMPPDTRRAIFTFKAIEESKSAFQRKCKPRDISVHLKASSYPVISPENITFPRNFLNNDERFKIYNLKFQSNESQHRITVEGPHVGNWFAVAFVSWTDPNNDRIEQQGLAASCDTLLLAEMSVSLFHPIIINNGQVHNSTLTSNTDEQNPNTTIVTQSAKNSQARNKDQQDMQKLQKIDAVDNVKYANTPTWSASDSIESKTTTSYKNSPKLTTKTETNTQIMALNVSTQPLNNASFSLSTPTLTSKSHTIKRSNASVTTSNEIIYKFYVPRNVGVATAIITFGHVCSQCPDVGFHIQSNAFPSTESEAEKRYTHSTLIKPNQTEEISIEFHVQPMTWHYALLKFVNQKRSMINSSEDSKEADPGPDSMRRPKRNVVASQYAGEKYDSPTRNHLPFKLQISFQDPLDETEKRYKNNQPEPGSFGNWKNDTKSSKPWDPRKFRGMEFYPLLRQTYREFFMYDYDLVPDENGTVPTLLNLTAGMPAGFAFDVGEVYDIGGTLSFAVSMKIGNKAGHTETTKTMSSIPSTNERSGILAEKLVGHSDTNEEKSNDYESEDKKTDDKNLPRSNQTIIVCMHHGEPGEPTWPDKCRYGRRLLPASSIVNNTDSNTSTGLIHVPFPESGQWYVTMGLYCHGAETASRATIIDSVKEFVRKYAYMLEDMRQPCSCSLKFSDYRDCINNADCLDAMNETQTLKIKECLMDSKCTSNHLEMTQKFEDHHKFATEQHFALDNCSTSVVFTVSSSPCVAGRCGRYGRCYHYMSGGFVFSTCVCMKGYRGWDCTEDSQVPSSISILMASLLLTLSNLLFLPSIFVAARRKFFSEAVIYFFAMIFSIFYHACDSGEDEYSFCLVKIGVLQFCDFYCGLLAIWVTLVAMSHIRQQFVSLLHMLGAIILAFGTELNKQSLWVFLAPALTGICLISASWGMRCYKSHKWFPARRYLTVFMPLGTVLVMTGLVCYAFLQTKQNYHIVHSIWHMVMALSILCLLPSRQSFIPKC